MSKKIIVTILLPVFLFACVALKPVEKLTDEELADRYDKIDLQIYMVKRAASKDNPSKYTGGSGSLQSSYSSGDIKKIKKLEAKLKVVRQELVKRGYIP
ncbi:MAG: hypothetical protein R2549_06940 [Candidatus Scalindua sp.]|nr:hypothetical protein [Candidatus Scalindua sp.]